MRVWEHIRGNVVGYVALLMAMSGTAYAATTLPANSVGTKQLQNAAVTNSKLAPDAVTGSKVKASTLGLVPRAHNADLLGGIPLTSLRAHKVWANVTPTAGLTVIGGFGPFTVKLGCARPSGSTALASSLQFNTANTVDADFQWAVNDVTHDSPPTAGRSGGASPASYDVIASPPAGIGDYVREYGTVFLSMAANSPVVFQFDYNMLVDNRNSSPVCSIRGALIPAT